MHSLTRQVLWITVVTAMYGVAPVQTKWILIIPYLVTSFLLMFGNWYVFC
jgi:hypothetical protein